MSRLIDTTHILGHTLRETLPFLHPTPEQMMESRQDHLRRNYAGQILAIGEFCTGHAETDQENANHLVKEIRRKEVIRGFGAMGVRSMVPASNRVDENRRNLMLQRDVKALGRAIEYHGAEPYVYEAPLYGATDINNSVEVNFEVIGRGLANFEDESRSINDDPIYSPKSYAIIMRPFEASKLFPDTGLSYGQLKNSGPMVLDFVGEEPAKNLWVPLKDL